MANTPRQSTDYASLPGGDRYSDVYAALADVVPPSEVHWLPSIAVAVQELVDACPWLGAELRFSYSPLRALPDLAARLKSPLPDSLPTHYVDEFPAQAALAICPTTDSWLRPPKALMMAVALRALPAGNSQDTPDASRAQKGFLELARFVRGLNYVHVRQRRAAFLRAAEQETTPHAYAETLCSLMEHPEHLPPSQDSRTAKPDARLLVALRRDILPVLHQPPSPRKPGNRELERKTEDWEMDDDGTPNGRIRLRLPSSAESKQDAFEDSVEILYDHTFDLGRVTLRELETFEEPFPRRVSATQAIHSANTHLSTFHADVLTEQEIRQLLPRLLQFLDNAIDSRDVRGVGMTLILLLMFATGLTKERVAAILHEKGRSGPDSPHLSPCCTELIAPAFNPHIQGAKNHTSPDLVVPSENLIRIPLPPRLVKGLLEFRQNMPSLPMSAPHLKEVYPILRSVADNAGVSAVTLGRVRRTTAPLLFEQCRDLVAVMQLTRDTFGKSTAPLHYVNFDQSVLRGIYRRAIWPRFGDDPKSANHAESPDFSRLGSAFCPVNSSVKNACAPVGSTLHAGKPAPESARSEEIAAVHNAMAAHIAAVLVSVVGHRPNDALFRLGIHDFGPELQLGLFADKDIDPAHLTRLVALGSEVSNQLRRYTDHLQGLVRCKNLPNETRGKVRRLLKGAGPLIFRLDDSARIRQWKTASWQASLPDQWRLLQPNFGRHYLATRGRELGYSAEWIHMQLGHQEVVGYPFSPDSPLFPDELAKQMGPLLDTLFAEQGWRRRSGFDPEESEVDSWAETGPLRVTYSHSVRHRHKLNRARKRFREELRAQLRPLKSDAERIIVELARTVSLDLSKALCFRYNRLRSARGERLLDWPADGRHPPTYLTHLSPVKIEPSDMMKLLAALEQKAGHNRAFRIALTNQLAYAIEWLRNRRKYSGPYCGAFRMRPLTDESPFFEGIFRATKQIRALREYFSTLRSSPFEKRSSNENNWELGKIALALAIFGHIDNLAVLTGLLSASANVERIPASSNSMLVHLTEPATTIGLHGTAALAYSRWKRLYGGLESTPEELRLTVNESLKLVIDDRFLRRGHGIEALLQSVSAANRVEMPGLFRTILDVEQGSVALPPERLRSLLDPAYRSAGPSGSRDRKSTWSLKRTGNVTEIVHQVRKLKALVPTSDKQLILPLTGEEIRLKSRQHEPARKKLLQELDRWAGHPDHDAIVRFLAGWLAHLVRRHKFRGPGYLRWKSVQNYLSLVATPLVGLIGRGGVKTFSVEDLEDLYLDVLANVPEGRQTATCTQLLDFHGYLVDKHGFEPIDVSIFRQFASAKTAVRSVSNQLVLPGERVLISHHLWWLQDPNSHPPETQADFRLHAQAYLCFALAAATGARISEIAGLKHKDVIGVGDEIGLILRPNGYRELKTPSARRLVNAGKGLSPEALQKFRRWLESERDRIGTDSFHEHYIFCDLEDELTGTAALRSWYTPTLKAVNRSIWSHHLRHARVNEIFLELLLGRQLQGLHQPGNPGAREPLELCLPRELSLETSQIGHRHPRTSAACYFHMPFAAGIAAQRKLHDREIKKINAAALGISSSGLDNLKQRWGSDYIAHALDRCCRRRGSGDASEVPRTIDLPEPVGSRLPRLSKSLDLLARGVPVAVVRESMGLTAMQVEMLLEQDRQQAINTGIALVPGNPNGNRRNSTYPRWRSGSTVLQFLWPRIELEQDKDAQALLRGWRLAADRGDRSRFLWDQQLIETVDKCLQGIPSLKIVANPVSRLHEVSVELNGCNINSELAYTLAVADVADTASELLVQETKSPQPAPTPPTRGADTPGS